MIKNLTTNKIVSEKVGYKLTFRDKLFGMILAANSGGIILKTRFGIHTFFMKNPIDIIIVDKNGKVARIKEGLLPNAVFFWNPKYDTVIELPKGSIKKSWVRAGDRLSLE